MDGTRAAARERGFVETVFGRRLYLPDIKSRNAALRSYAERAAINAPMQGTAADIIKRAMIEVHRGLTGIAHARLLMQVHDELVLEVAEPRVDEVIAQVRRRWQVLRDCASRCASTSASAATGTKRTDVLVR
jgi:DNA polymerase-1